jgi:hypothetical protein
MSKPIEKPFPENREQTGETNPRAKKSLSARTRFTSNVAVLMGRK